MRSVARGLEGWRSPINLIGWIALICSRRFEISVRFRARIVSTNASSKISKISKQEVHEVAPRTSTWTSSLSSAGSFDLRTLDDGSSGTLNPRRCGHGVAVGYGVSR